MDFQNPVIVIPGITATDLNDDYPLDAEKIWSMVLNKNYDRVKLHPDNLRFEAHEPSHTYTGQIFDIYNDLLEALRHELSSRADEPTPVFAFPYDWRIDIRETAKRLTDFIDEVIERTLLLKHYKGGRGKIKVDLVGHSMGGLIITEYLSQQKNSSRAGKIVTIGTPYLGSIEAVVKTTTGMGLLSGSTPKEREREAARATPSIYQLFPSYDRCVIDQDGNHIDLFKPTSLQRSIKNSLKEYIRLYSVDTPYNRRDSRANEILLDLLTGGIKHRENVNSFKLSDAKIKQHNWLAVVGIGCETRIQIDSKKTRSGPWFVIKENQFVNELTSDNPDSRKTGDGTVPLAGALPPFLPESSLVCVTPDDLGRFELRDKVLVKVAGLHGLLPAINLVQRLTIKHLKDDFGGPIWGRRVPGATSWNPPIKDLTDERSY